MYTCTRKKKQNKKNTEGRSYKPVRQTIRAKSMKTLYTRAVKQDQRPSVPSLPCEKKLLVNNFWKVDCNPEKPTNANDCIFRKTSLVSRTLKVSDRSHIQHIKLKSIICRSPTQIWRPTKQNC